MQEKARFVP